MHSPRPLAITSLGRLDGRTLAEGSAPGVRVPAPSRALANVANLITQNGTARGWYELETEPGQGRLNWVEDARLYVWRHPRGFWRRCSLYRGQPLFAGDTGDGNHPG